MQKYAVFFISMLLLASCSSLSPHRMFQTPKDYAFELDTAKTASKEYVISKGDRIDMHFYSIEGFRLVDVTNTIQAGGETGINYIVEQDGEVKLPVLGKVPITGKTVHEAEKYLEELYSKYYISPFILLKVTNRRIYVFFGDSGHGTAINLISDNTSIIEAIASAGGLTENSKAWRIKVIRGDLSNPKIYLVDLSTIEGMKQSNFILQSNDIIYIESTPNYKSKLLAQITPIIGIITSVLLVYNILQK